MIKITGLRSLVRLGYHLKPLLPYQFLILVFLLMEAASSLVFPYITKLIIDDALPNGDMSLLRTLTGILLCLLLLNLGISFLCNYLYAWVGNRMIVSLRVDVFSVLIKKSASFYWQKETGDLLYRINADAASIQGVLTTTIPNLFHSVFTFAGILVAMLLLSWKLTLMLLISVPLLTANLIIFQPKIRNITKMLAERGSKIIGHILENLQGVSTIQLNETFDRECTQFKHRVDKIADLDMRRVAYMNSMRVVSNSIIGCAPAAILFFGGSMVAQGSITVGSLVALLQYLGRLFTPMKNLNQLYTDLIKAGVSADRIIDILDDVPKPIHHASSQSNLSESVNILELRQIGLRFGEQWVLRNLSLQLKPGQTYVITGENGSGKSSIVNIICGFVDVCEGGIYLNNQEVRSNEIQLLRRKISLATRKPDIFSGTVLDNIFKVHDKK